MQFQRQQVIQARNSAQPSPKVALFRHAPHLVECWFVDKHQVKTVATFGLGRLMLLPSSPNRDSQASRSTWQTKKSTSNVARVCPCAATAYPPMMRNCS